MSLRHLPNLLCGLRILLIYPVAHGILAGHYPAVMGLFAIAAFTDGLDGFLAKRFGWQSELGKVLDPVADKLLLVTMFICLAVVARAAFGGAPGGALVTALGALATVTTAVSGIDYVLIYSRRAAAVSRARSGATG
jgi:cardiolipin synthase